MMMNISSTDPRDVTGEADPVFRAHLWQTTGRGLEMTAFVLDDCDVAEALAWMNDATPHRGRGQLFVAIEGEDGVELIRLFDTDPDAGIPEGSGAARGWGR